LGGAWKLATVLVVEGNAPNRDLIRRRLERFGHIPLVADSASLGVAIATEAKPDLILMDVSLDNAEGFAAIERIKADPDLKTVPVIAVSTSSSTEDRAKAIEAGCIDLVSVPLDFTALIAKMETTLNSLD